MTQPDRLEGVDGLNIDIAPSQDVPQDNATTEATTGTEIAAANNPLGALIAGVITEGKYIDLIQAQREKNGLSPLVRDTDGVLTPEWVLKP